MNETLAIEGSWSSRGFLSEAQGRSGPRRQGQVGDDQRLWCRKPRPRWSLNPAEFPGGVLKGWFVNLRQDQWLPRRRAAPEASSPGIFPPILTNVLPKLGSVWAECS